MSDRNWKALVLQDELKIISGSIFNNVKRDFSTEPVSSDTIIYRLNLFPTIGETAFIKGSSLLYEFVLCPCTETVVKWW